MSTYTIDTEKTPDTSAPQAKGKRTTAKKAKTAKKARQPKKAAGKPKAERTNKKAEVVALMKRPRGATLVEIVAPRAGRSTRSVVSLASSAVREARRSNRPRARMVSGRTRSPRSQRAVALANAASVPTRGGVPSLCRPHCSASDVTDRRRHWGQTKPVRRPTGSRRQRARNGSCRRTGAHSGVRMGGVGKWMPKGPGASASGYAVEHARNGLKAPGRGTASPVGLVVQGGGDRAHGGAFVAQPPDLGERGLLGRIGFQVLAVVGQPGRSGRSR
jgi:hypothetical protein